MRERVGSTRGINIITIIIIIIIINILSIKVESKPIEPHERNSHYLQYNDEPTILISSGEHYGAVLNLDFNYSLYLSTISNEGLTMTRTWTGAVYREVNGSFDITLNTLAPLPNRYLSPFARSDEAGYIDGGNKFDLTQWDKLWFARMLDFLSQAEERGIIVNIGLFCPFYNELLWQYSPLNPSNNVNNFIPSSLTKDQVYILKYPEVQQVLDNYVVQVVTQLNGFDNIYYEIMNEPWSGNITDEWQTHISSLISATEKNLPKQHMIAKTFHHGKIITDLDPNVSLINFHYNTPLDAWNNYDRIKLPLSDDETGFCGPLDVTYRNQAWRWIISGGAVFNMLDYSFTVGHEDGSAPVGLGPSGGTPALRKQLSILLKIMNSVDFLNMAPNNQVIVDGVPSNGNAYVLANEGVEYLLYFDTYTPDNIYLSLSPSLSYSAQWIDPLTGNVTHSLTVTGSSSTLFVPPPASWSDYVLLIRKH